MGTSLYARFSIIVNIKACLFLLPLAICVCVCVGACTADTRQSGHVLVRLPQCAWASVRVCVFVLMTKHRTLGPRAKRNETLCGISSRDFEEAAAEPSAVRRTGHRGSGTPGWAGLNGPGATEERLSDWATEAAEIFCCPAAMQRKTCDKYAAGRVSKHGLEWEVQSRATTVRPAVRQL